jgi:hypothetical protein
MNLAGNTCNDDDVMMKLPVILIALALLPVCTVNMSHPLSLAD